MLLIILIVIISPFTYCLFRHQIAIDDGLFCCVYPNVHFGINNSVLSIYHQNNFEDHFHLSEDEGLFHVFFPQIVISISYGSYIFMYMNPSAKDRVSLNNWVALLNTSVIPMLNPFICTLRNLKVKSAFMDMKTVLFSGNEKIKALFYKLEA